jgi:hypothetical protein
LASPLDGGADACSGCLLDHVAVFVREMFRTATRIWEQLQGIVRLPITVAALV